MSTQETYLKGIADAIRAKTGLTGTIKASEFAAKISAIQTGVAKPTWKAASIGMRPRIICHGPNLSVGLITEPYRLYSGDTNHYNGVTSNYVCTSDSGIIWGGGNYLPSTQIWSSVCYGGGKFVAIAYNSSVAAYSTDGYTWTSTSLPGSRGWTSIAYIPQGGYFVAVNDNTAFAARSVDGITWTSVRMPSSSAWVSICSGSTYTVAVSLDGKIARTLDGSFWVELSNVPSGSWGVVCFGFNSSGNSTYVALSQDSNNSIYSTNGITWQLSNGVPSRNWASVCCGGGKFMAVASDYAEPMYTIDGINWTLGLAPPSVAGDTVGYKNGNFTISGKYGTYYLNDYFKDLT